LNSALERLHACVEAGADMIFPEAVTELSLYAKFAEATGVPVLANITEFGVTPLFNLQQLRGAKVALALYPLSAFRAMSVAALKVYSALRSEGTQAGVLDAMQSRNDLYRYLDYDAYEQRLDRLFQEESSKRDSDK
jgi:methylisocitrate lyase